jgi:hypothetical protein
MIPALIILFVVAVALVPLIQFKPSARQREIARLRECAALNGLFVEFRDVPGREEYRRQAGANPGTVIYYGKRLPAKVQTPDEPRHWITHDGQWQAVGRWRAIPDPVAQLAVPLLAASVARDSCGVYWTEGGTVADVEAISRALATWSEALDG